MLGSHPVSNTGPHPVFYTRFSSRFLYQVPIPFSIPGFHPVFYTRLSLRFLYKVFIPFSIPGSHSVFYTKHSSVSYAKLAPHFLRRALSVSFSPSRVCLRHRRAERARETALWRVLAAGQRQGGPHPVVPRFNRYTAVQVGFIYKTW